MAAALSCGILPLRVCLHPLSVPSVGSSSSSLPPKVSSASLRVTCPRRYSNQAPSRPFTVRSGSEGPSMQESAAPTEGGLAKEKCIPCHNKTLSPLSKEEAQALLQQEVPQWELVEVEGVPRLRRTWKTKNFLAGLEFFSRISHIAEAEGHHPDLHLEGWNNARVEVFTHSIGGLHKNDFILAAKIEALNVSDLLRKPKKSFASA